jgi:hypothetical protein
METQGLPGGKRNGLPEHEAAVCAAVDRRCHSEDWVRVCHRADDRLSGRVDRVGRGGVELKAARLRERERDPNRGRLPGCVGCGWQLH